MSLSERAAGLPPAAFSFVMATGINATAADLLGWRPVAWALFVLNVAGYALLVVLATVRVLAHRERVWADFQDHAKAPGFLSLVAGTCVLGTQWVTLVGQPAVAAVFWGLGLVLWGGLTYGFFLVMTIRVPKPPIEQALGGSWMMVVVATQAVSLLGTLLAPDLEGLRQGMLGLSLGFFLLGCMFYVVLVGLVLYRFLFFVLDPRALSPPYWILMGAVAITTLSGSLLMLRSGLWPFLAELRPFLRGFTLLFWVTGTWWIPLLLLLGVWRHVRHRVPIHYDVQFWSMAFPLGMYTVATYRLAEALGWAALVPLAKAVGVLALLTWGLTFSGLVRSLLRER